MGFESCRFERGVLRKPYTINRLGLRAAELNEEFVPGFPKIRGTFWGLGLKVFLKIRSTFWGSPYNKEKEKYFGSKWGIYRNYSYGS